MLIWTDGTTKYTKVGVDNKILGVPYVTGISYASRDLNDYKSPVITFANNNTGVWSNCPTNNAFILIVLVSGNLGQTSFSYIRQILFGYNQSNLVYTRAYDPNRNTWDSWYRPS